MRLRNCGVAVAERHSLKSCGIAIVEVLPSSCGVAIADSKKSCTCPPLYNRQYKHENNRHARHDKFLDLDSTLRCGQYGTVSYYSSDLTCVGNKIAQLRGLHKGWRRHFYRWALSPKSVISDIGLSLISEPLISVRRDRVRHYIGYRNKLFLISDIRHSISIDQHSG